MFDANGAHVATLSEVSNGPGIHRVIWDMRYPPATSVGGATFWDAAGAAGPPAPPGRYEARLTVGAAVQSEWFEILPDPRVEASPDDLVEQFRLLVAIRDRLLETYRAANRIAALRGQIAAWRARSEQSALAAVLAEVDRKLAEIDDQLIDRSGGLSYAGPIRLNAKSAALAAMVDSADAVR